MTLRRTVRTLFLFVFIFLRLLMSPLVMVFVKSRAVLRNFVGRFK